MSVRRTLVDAARRVALLLSLGIVTGLGVGSALAQTAPFDGTYAGTQTLTDDPVEHNYSKCLKGPFKRKMVVKGGRAVYTYNPTYDGQVSGIVDADGNVSGSVETSSGGVALSGKIQGDQFTGKVWSIICSYAVDLKRAP
jgi:hypothetical protein